MSFLKVNQNVLVRDILPTVPRASSPAQRTYSTVPPYATVSCFTFFYIEHTLINTRLCSKLLIIILNINLHWSLCMNIDHWAPWSRSLFPNHKSHQEENAPHTWQVDWSGVSTGSGYHLSVIPESREQVVCPAWVQHSLTALSMTWWDVMGIMTSYICSGCRVTLGTNRSLEGMTVIHIGPGKNHSHYSVFHG